MFNSPLISVIIPTYNRSEIIPISINSVLRQSYSNWEIIVVDDCSEDNTEEVVKEYGDARIQYVRHEQNLGGSVARNTGIDASQGEFIAFLDSDDAWVPHKLESQYLSLINQASPKRTISYTQVFYSSDGITEQTFNNISPTYCLPERGKSDCEPIGDYLFRHKGKVLTSTLMMHREILELTRFRDELKKHQDWDLALRLEAQGASFFFIKEPLTIWNGDSRFEHVGRNPNYELSEAWLESCRQYLSAPAITQFRLDKILPALIEKNIRRKDCQKILLESLFLNRLSVKNFLKQSRRVWT